MIIIHSRINNAIDYNGHYYSSYILHHSSL